MAGAASLARLSTLYMAAVGGTTPAIAVPYERFNNGIKQALINTGRRVNWGTLSQPVNKVRRNTRSCLPTMSLIPNAIEWENLLQWCQGGTPAVASGGGTTTTTFPLGNTALERSLTHYDQYESCDLLRVGVDRMVIRSRQQQELELELGCVGTDFTVPTAFNTTTLANTIFRSTAPSFLHSDLTITIAGTSTYKAASIEVETVHGIPTDRFFNTTTMPSVIKMDRVHTMRLSLPFGLHYALWGLGAADGSLAMSLAFTFTVSAATYTLTGTFPAVKAEQDPVEYATGDETYLDWVASPYAPDDGTPPPLLEDEVVWSLARPT